MKSQDDVNYRQVRHKSCDTCIFMERKEDGWHCTKVRGVKTVYAWSLTMRVCDAHEFEG